MGIVRQALQPVRRAAHLFFRCQLRMSVRGGVRMQLVEGDGSRPASAEEIAMERERAEVALMLRELGEALDEMPDIRDSLRHLVFVEQAVAQQGLAALEMLPMDVLQRGLEQFEGLVTNWSPRGLAGLRSRMAVTVGERARRLGESQAMMLPPAQASQHDKSDGPVSVR
jgi:hypothetical protein